jgi:hypothetical protein
MVRISVLNHFVEENNTRELRNFVPDHSAKDKNAQNSVPNYFAEEQQTVEGKDSTHAGW